MLRLLLILYFQSWITTIYCKGGKECNGENNNLELVDSVAPEGEYLSAIYKRSYAYGIVKNRMPHVVDQVIDSLDSKRCELKKTYGDVAETDIENVLTAMYELKQEVQSNSELRNLTSPLPDAQFYNDYIANLTKEKMKRPRYYYTYWLLSETYLYRRIREAFESANSLKNFDPFQCQKEDTFRKSLPIIRRISRPFMKLTNTSGGADKEDFIKMLKLNLWGNKCDLSHSVGCVTDKEGEDLMDVKSMDEYLVRDDSNKIWDAISDKAASSNIVDIVMDNAAYELFTDLCFADYIITSNLATKVRFYVKTIPWFISDTMRKDLYWVISQLMTDPDEILANLGSRWSKYLEDGKWKIEEKTFWTLPVAYSKMKEVDPDLYKQLGESKLIVVKGDLNYRKLFNDRSWNPTTPVDDGLEGFNPGKLCSLRTLKADIVCGLTQEVVDKVSAADDDWLTSGKYGMIVFTDKVLPLE